MGILQANGNKATARFPSHKHIYVHILPPLSPGRDVYESQIHTVLSYVTEGIGHITV